MLKKYIEEEEFRGENYRETPLPEGHYELCTFQQCQFSNTSLAGIEFSECEFIECDLSNVNVQGAQFQSVRFRDCKLLGLGFDRSSEMLFSVDFAGCQLDHSIFYQCQLKKTYFKACSLKEVDFSEAQLEGAIFESCDLAGATFDRTNLRKADLRLARGYTIDPTNNDLKGAKVSQEGLAGFLGGFGLVIS